MRSLKSSISDIQKRGKYYTFFWRFQSELEIKFRYCPRGSDKEFPFGKVFPIESQSYYRLGPGRFVKQKSVISRVGPYLLERIESACREKWPGKEGYVSSDANFATQKATEIRKNWKPRKANEKPPANEGSRERIRTLMLIIAADAITFTAARAGGQPSKSLSDMAYAGYTESEIKQACGFLGSTTDELFWFANSRLGWDGKQSTPAEITAWIASNRAKWAA